MASPPRTRQGAKTMSRNGRASSTRALSLAAVVVASAATFEILSCLPAADAVAASPHPFQEVNADGSLSVTILAKGSERHHYLTDSEGYPVVAEPAAQVVAKVRMGGGGGGGDTALAKNIVYAERDARTGKLIATELRADSKVNPSKVGLLHKITADEEGEDELKLSEQSQKPLSMFAARSFGGPPAEGGGVIEWGDCGKYCDDAEDDDDTTWAVSNEGNRGLRGSGGAEESWGAKQRRRLNSNPCKEQLANGVLKNLVVPIRFADHKYRTLPSTSDLDKLMNAEGGDPDVAPSGSVRDVFLLSSYGKLDVRSTVLPWILLSENEAYYADGNSGSSARFEEALQEALDKIKDVAPDFAFDESWDRDEDGVVDAISFMYSGYGAEWGATDCMGAAVQDRIWAHKFKLSQPWSSPPKIVGGRVQSFLVRNYHTASALWSTCGSDIARVGTTSHEIGHILGLPDLYVGGNGIGNFGLMGNSWGFDGSQRYPPFMSAWSKIMLGWVEPRILTESGTYEIEASEKAPVIYVLNAGYPEGEYLVVENRQPVDFDSKLPQGGCLIYHVNEQASFSGHPGYPDQEGWPYNGNHYRIAVLQADGEYSLEKGRDQGDEGDVFHQGSGRSLGPSESKSGPYPNTDAYQNGVVTKTGHVFENFSESGLKMTFDFKYEGNGIPKAGLAMPPPSSQGHYATTTTTAAPSKPSGTLLGMLTSGGNDEAESDGDEKELQTVMVGGNGSFGNMFDVVNINSSPICVTGLDIHTRIVTDPDAEGEQVHVWTVSGSHHDHVHNPDAWTKIASVKVRGMGHMVRTRIPSEAFEKVTVAPGETQAFYVSLETPDIRYTPGNGMDAENGDIIIKEGGGVGDFPFGMVYSPRKWNGFVRYVVKDDNYDGDNSVGDDAQEGDGGTLLSGGSSSVAPTTYSVTTTYEDDNGSYGTMFEVTASQDLTITAMDIHTRKVSSGVPVEVYTLPGSFQGHEENEDEWECIVDATVVGRGKGEPTEIPCEDFKRPVQMRSGETRSFYVTLKTADLRYTHSASVDSTYQSQDGALTINSMGAGVGAYKFSTTYFPRAFNGAVKYQLGLNDSPHSTPQAPSTSGSSVNMLSGRTGGPLSLMSQSNKKELFTTLHAGTGSFGSMFDVQALDRDIKVLGFDIHTRSTDEISVEVYTKRGTWVGHEYYMSKWGYGPICATDIQGQGEFSRTPIPENDFTPVVIRAGETQGFYITLKTPDIRYSVHEGDDKWEASNSDLKITEGGGVGGYPFGQVYTTRIFNGSIRYEFV